MFKPAVIQVYIVDHTEILQVTSVSLMKKPCLQSPLTACYSQSHNKALFGLGNPCYYRLQFHLGSLQTQRANGEHRGSKIDLNSSICHCMPVSATLKTRIVMKYFSTIKSINNTGGTSCLCLHGQSNRLQNALQSDLHQKI